MNRRQMFRTFRVLGVALVSLALPVWAEAPTTSHSGIIMAVNKAAGTIVLGEIGPWRVKDGATEITERTIAVTPATQFKQVKRTPGAGPAGWIGELVEVRLGAWEVKKGDFVTVEVRREGQRLSALAIVVVVPSKP